MLFLIIILLLTYPLELISNTICSQNETILVSDSHFRLKNENNYELIEQFEPFTYINALDYELQDYNITLVTKAQNKDRLLFVFQNNNDIHIRICMLHFEIMQDTMTNYTFKTENEITIQPIGKLLNAYFYENYLYLVYEEILDPLEYLIQIIDHNTQIVLDQKRIRKEKNCIFNIEEDSFNFFYFTQFNCSDWVVYLYSINTFEVWRKIQFGQFKQILRLISLAKFKRIVQLTFDNNVYLYSPNIDYFEEIFVYYDRNILFYNQEFHILSAISKDEFQNINHKAIIRKERPKKVLHQQMDLIFLFDSHIELVKNTDLSFNSTIQLDDIFNFQITYPYIYGVKNNQLILLRGNQMNPLFNCIGNKSQNVIFYKEQHENQYDWVFTTKKMEIKNVQIQYFNICENIFQEQIPILIEEIKQDQLEFQIFFNNFILGGPFDILDAKFNNKNIIIQEDMQPSICKFIDFNNILWWVIFIYENNLQQVLLYQDNTLFLYLINCDLQITKRLFKLGNINKSQIYQNKQLLLIQQRKQLVFLFELKNNLVYRFQSFSFNNDIKQIQLISGYFQIYLENWESYLIYSGNQESMHSVTYVKSELNNETILYKQITLQEVYIATESQVILYNRQYQHIIQVSNFYNIIVGKQKQFVIIHKSKMQDQIKITLKKYYLHNFHFKFMFELPKPNQSFEYIYPICIKENNQFLSIAAKDTTTNNTFVLIYEISQSYSRILKEIIQVDCCECLILPKFGVIFYQFQNKLFKKNVEFIKFKVQFQNKQHQIQSNNISFTLKSKINNKIIEGVQIQLISFSQIEELIIKKQQNLILKNFETVVFDPRKIIQGSLQNITSSSVIITPAFQLIASTILVQKSPNDVNSHLSEYQKVIQRLNTTKFDGIKCCKEINYPNNIVVLLEENGDHIFIIEITRKHQDIQIFNSSYILEYQLNLQTDLCNIIGSIISIDNYYFIICQDLILLYEVNSNKIEYLSQITHQLIECNIEKVSNKPYLYLAYDKKSPQQYCILIEILETNQINTITFIIDIDKYLNSLSEAFFRIVFKNIEYYEGNYLSMTGFYFKQKLYAQLFKLKIDINSITNVTHSGIIRYQKNTEIQKLLYINQFIVIQFLQSNSYVIKLCLYDLHEMEQFEIFDPISILEGMITDIMYHDNSSFILIEKKNQNYIFSKYQINQYQFEFIKQEGINYSIRLNNQLNSIEMIITFSDSNFYLKLEILLVNLICILIQLSRKRIRKNEEKRSLEKMINITLKQ